MGNSISTDDVIELDNEISPVDLTTLDCLEDEEDQEDDALMTMDANETRVTSTNLFNVNNIRHIESLLDFYEKVSLVYLLYNDAKQALDKMRSLFQQPNTEIISDWYQYNKCTPYVQDVLLESLTIIQNYEILKELEQEKTALKAQFLPSNKLTSLFVNKIRKCLYLICEDLESTQMNNLISRIKNDLQENFKYFEDSYMEMYFLHWESINYFTKDNLKKLMTAFKQLDMEEYYNCLECLIPDVANNPIVKKSNENGLFKKKLVKADERFEADNDEADDEADNDDTSPDRCTNNNELIQDEIRSNQYNIDPEKPGLCLIINQQNFYKEFDKKYGPFPEDFTALDLRVGSDKDRDRLKATFDQFNFKVIIKNDLDHVLLLKEIEAAASEARDYSSFFVCILSHGIEGHVYGVNSLPIRVDKIYDKMNNNKTGQPKVLILQSCQGRVCQVKIDENLETDGPGSVSGIQRHAHMMVFWATVPGFAAVRHKKNGSWFIQTLCDKILQLNRYHFLDICTFVQKEVNEKRWRKEEQYVGMVPIMQNTFTKFLYLPKLKSF